jgi:hypothetical protein
MPNWSKSITYGGIYASSLHQENSTYRTGKYSQKYQIITGKIRDYQKNLEKFWGKSQIILLSTKNHLQNHITRKQEVYWPVLIAIILLLFAFASKIASAEIAGSPNNLPISDGNSKQNLIGFGKNPTAAKNCLANAKSDNSPNQKESDEKEKNKLLKDDVAKIVKNTPMAAMTDSISKKDRTVAAFIVGIAMKESKFGVYAPHIGGRDCYNYWGLKAGGRTTAGGYSCFNSPDEAVSVVGKTIEKMVAKGVRNPAQAISWKCGSSCAGHDPAGVRKWIADVGVNFYKINS